MVSADMTKKKRETVISNTFASQNVNVVITSYHLLSGQLEMFCQGPWDYIILDEGHCIKNPTTKMSKAIYELSCKHRLLLTGSKYFLM
jgi:SNF2 family DNA or RNA helicase